MGSKQIVVEERPTPNVNAVTMFGGVDEIKRVMHETVKTHEIILKIEEKTTKLDNEISKIYDSIIYLRKVYTEEIGNQKNFESKGFAKRIEELESNYGIVRQNIDELKGEFPLEHNDENKNNLKLDSFKKFNESDKEFQKTNDLQTPSANTGLTFRDFVKSLGVSIKQQSEKIEKLNNRIDMINSEILEKVKSNLSVESSKILDNFKLELKFSISKIEEQMREKVDRFNMEEFSKKLEIKMYNEMSKKLDRLDLKKNNNMINKKVFQS